MNNQEPIFVKSRLTGGHYAFKTEKSTKPFENPMTVNTSIKLNKNDIVVDIGAYVGEYSMWASKYVKIVNSYEPTPETFKLLKKNKKSNINIYNLAVVGNNKKTTKLFISTGIGVTNSTVKLKQNYIEVPTIKYENAIKNATIVKIDVEGAEYTYNIVQPQLRGILLEFHPIAKKPWKYWASIIMKNIENAGFKNIIKPTFKNGWSLTGSWLR